MTNHNVQNVWPYAKQAESSLYIHTHRHTHTHTHIYIYKYKYIYIYIYIHIYIYIYIYMYLYIFIYIYLYIYYIIYMYIYIFYIALLRAKRICYYMLMWTVCLVIALIVFHYSTSVVTVTAMCKQQCCWKLETFNMSSFNI